jgi:hypothetical protein
MFILSITASCGGSVDYAPSAEKMCTCMEEKGAEEKGDFDLGPEADYASCVLDVTISESVDLNTEEFTKQLEKDCPDLVDLHKNYMESSN